MLSGVDQVLPVDLYVPGCAARPEIIMDGILKCFDKPEDLESLEEPADAEDAEKPDDEKEKAEVKDSEEEEQDDEE